MKRKAYSRGEREEQILNVFYTMVGDGKDPHMTAYQMAKALGLNSAQHARNILEKMVTKDILTFTEEYHRPGVLKRVYIPIPLIWMPSEEKQVEPLFRINGKVVK